MKNEFEALANHSVWSEKAIEKYLVRKVEEVGGMALKYSNANKTGFPDRLCLFPNGTMAFVELKGNRGIVSPIQLERLLQLAEMKFNTMVISTKEGVDSFVYNMTHDSQGNEI